MIGAHLLDTCRITRAAPQPDGYGGDDTGRGEGWAMVAAREPCRLVIKQQRVGDGVLAERPFVTAYLMLFRPGADVRKGDRVEAVVLRDGTADGATYRIEALLPRRARGLRHISATLERIG